MPKMTVEVDLAELGKVETDPETGEPLGPPADMRSMVIDSVTERLFAHVYAGIKREIVDELREGIHEEVRNVVRSHVVQALSQPIQRTSPWGEKQGEPTTLLELIRLELKDFLNGKECRRDFGSSREEPRNLAELVKQEVRKYASTDLSKDIHEARKVVTEQVKTAMLANFTEAVAKGR